MLIYIVILLSGCEVNSGVALFKIESGTKTSWKRSYDYLKGTEKHTLSLGKEPQERKNIKEALKSKRRILKPLLRFY